MSSSRTTLSGAFASGGVVTFPDGSAAAPSITFTNDTTTGLFLAAAGRLGVAASGSQVAEFDTTSIDFFGTTITFTAAGNITARADTDGTFIFGRGLLDARSTDAICISHVDRSGVNDFALRQGATGATALNGAAVFYSIAGATAGGINASSNFFFGGSFTPTGKVHIRQASTTAAIPVINLEQLDVSEEFIRFTGTSAAANITNTLVREASIGGETRVAWAKVFVTDTSGGIAGAFFVPLYTLV